MSPDLFAWGSGYVTGWLLSGWILTRIRERARDRRTQR